MKSFEEACKLSKIWVTQDRLVSLGVVETMRVYTEYLTEAGWTTESLCAEARRRMQERIATLDVRSTLR